MIWKKVASRRAKAAVILTGVYSLVCGLGMLATGGLMLGGTAVPVDTALALAASIVIALGLLILVAACALISAKEWGRKLTIAVSLVTALCGGVSALDPDFVRDGYIAVLIAVVLDCLAVFYLMKRSTRDIFRSC